MLKISDNPPPRTFEEIKRYILFSEKDTLKGSFESCFVMLEGRNQQGYSPEVIGKVHDWASRRKFSVKMHIWLKPRKNKSLGFGSRTN